MTSLTTLQWRARRLRTDQLRREYLDRRNLPLTLGNRTCLRLVRDELVAREGLS